MTTQPEGEPSNLDWVMLRPGQGMDRSRAGQLLPPAARRAEDKKTPPARSPAQSAFGASTALASPGPALAGRMEPQAGQRRGQGISQRRERRRPGGRDAAHSAAHRSHLADAARHRQVGGRRVSRDDRGAARQNLWAPPSRSPQGAARVVRPAATASPQEARNRTRTNVVECHENCQSFALVNACPDVRDVGVAGSNPATPTIT